MPDATRKPAKIPYGAPVPSRLWGGDHFSVLAYMETLIADLAGFQVGFDARMRANRHNFRLMHEGCPRPKRARHAPAGIPMDGLYGSRLNDGSAIADRDDWSCVRDMTDEGYFVLQTEDGARSPCGRGNVEAGAILELSDKGCSVANALRAHKAAGHPWSAFRLPEDALA